MLTFSVNFYEAGKLLSIVATNHPHGTHVAAISAGYFPNCEAKNGIAPGAKIVSIKIGDITKNMMDAEYSLREKNPDMPSTWSSRGLLVVPHSTGIRE